MDQNGEKRRKPVPIGILICLALIILGLALIFKSFGPSGLLPGPAPELPAETSPMRQFIPDSEFPEEEETREIRENEDSS